MTEMDRMIRLLKKEELASAESLLNQYNKERSDALNGTGICKFMGEAERTNIARRLQESIISKEKEIAQLKKELE